MPHVIWHCNGNGRRLRYEKRVLEFRKNGLSVYEWVRPDGMTDSEAAAVDRKLKTRQQRQLKIIAKATGGKIRGNGVGPVDYSAEVNFPVYRNGLATYNWLPSHDMSRARVLKIDGRLERLRQEQIAIIAEATGGEQYGDASMHEGYGRYPHTDPAE